MTALATEELGAGAQRGTDRLNVNEETLCAWAGELFRSTTLSRGAKIVAGVLVNTFVGKKTGQCSLSWKKLGAACGMSESSVPRNIRELEALGALEVARSQGRGGTTHRISLKPPPRRAPESPSTLTGKAAAESPSILTETPKLAPVRALGDLAEALGVTRAAIYKAADRGDIGGAVRAGGRRRIRCDAFDYHAARGFGPGVPPFGAADLPDAADDRTQAERFLSDPVAECAGGRGE